MNKWPMRALVCIATMLAAAGCGGPSSGAQRPQGIPLLLGDVTSCASQADVRASLGSRELKTLERTPAPPADPRKRVELVTLGTEYSHRGYGGDLELVFFNDRLMAATFYPADIDGYTAALQRAGVNVARRVSLAPQQHLHVVWMRDYEGREYVQWTDTRLTDEYER